MTIRTYGAHLFIDGGNGSTCPVRVIGYIEEKAFVLEEVWIDYLPMPEGPVCFNIIENLSDGCIERLQDEANEQAAEDGEL